MAPTHRQNDKHTHGHGDSMTDPAQRAESVKNIPDCKRKTENLGRRSKSEEKIIGQIQQP